MMASLNSQALTPVPNGAETLPISGVTSNGAPRQASTVSARNSEAEKAQRLNETLTMLKTRIAGRGVCREGVKRLAQQAGFTHLWQEDVLTIAGNCVDLEIAFDTTNRDKVMDVALKILTSDGEEHKRDASEVLKHNLFLSQSDRPWQSLDDFAQNLAQLGTMDSLSQGINCFEAIEGLFFALKEILKSEAVRDRSSHVLWHVNYGLVGRPLLNQRPRLGLRLDYWSGNSERESPPTCTDSHFREREPHAQAELDLEKPVANPWALMIACEAGYPSLRVSKDWLSCPCLRPTDGEVMDDFVNARTSKIHWKEPSATLVTSSEGMNQAVKGEMAMDEVKIPRSPEVRFVAYLNPPLLVPLAVASSLMSREDSEYVLDQNQIISIEQQLQRLAGQNTMSEDGQLDPPPLRLSRSMLISREGGPRQALNHLYTFYSNPTIWCCPLKSLAFGHPKQLEELLPTLRQFVLFWTLLRSISSSNRAFSQETTPEPVDKIASHDRDPKSPSRKRDVKRSNLRPRGMETDLLDDRLADLTPEHSSDLGHAGFTKKDTSTLAIDVSFSMITGTQVQPRIELFWPLPPSATERFGSVVIEIGLGGKVNVPSASGLPNDGPEKWLDMISRVSTLSEDLGLVVEWLMNKVHCRVK